MSGVTLPDIIRGSWIWSQPETNNDRESHAFFKRDFNLDEIPASTEVWIACHSFFNLYVNGQHLSFGPSPSIRTKSYVQYFDITFLLQMGKNSICIQATNADISRYGTTRQEAGLWCQMQIDGDIQFVTDNSWHSAPASHLLPGQFRISPSMGFVERIFCQSRKVASVLCREKLRCISAAIFYAFPIWPLVACLTAITQR